MKRFFRFSGVLLSLGVLLLFVAALTSAQDTSELVIGFLSEDPNSIDPQRTISTGDWSMMDSLFPALVRLDEEANELLGGIASSWEVSDDGLVTTFHLIEGIPWVRYNAETEEVEQVLDDDGNPRILDAHDVVYGWQRAFAPETGASAVFMVGPVIAGADAYNSGEGTVDDMQIRAVDDFTFEVTAPEVLGFSLQLYGLNIVRPVPQWAIDDAGDAWIEPENINTYGPLALKDWSHDESMTYVKNPFWPGSDAYSEAQSDQVVVRFLENSVALREYEAGNLDITLQVPFDQIPRLQADAVLSQELTLFPGVGSTAWGFNVEKAPFDNVHMRRAFSYAMDRESNVDNILQGAGVPAAWWTPPSISMAPSPETDPDFGIRFDPAKAQEELQLALDEMGLSSIDELPPITIQFRDQETWRAQAEALQVMFEDTLGIRVELEPADATTYWANLEVESGQIHYKGWGPDYNDANNFTRDVHRSDGVYNYGRYNNPEWDQMVDTARRETDPEVRRDMYREIERIFIVEDAAVIPSYWTIAVSLEKPNVERTSFGIFNAFWKWSKTE